MSDLYEELYWVWEERLQYMVENAGYKPSSKHEELTLEILVLGWRKQRKHLISSELKH